MYAFQDIGCNRDVHAVKLRIDNDPPSNSHILQTTAHTQLITVLINYCINELLYQ